jgi:hypothetical protein
MQRLIDFLTVNVRYLEKSVTLKMTEKYHRVHLMEVEGNYSWLLNVMLYVISTSYHIYFIVNYVTVIPFSNPLICHFILGALSTSIKKLSVYFYFFL